MPLSNLEYKIVRDLVLKRSGIVLDVGKEYLIEARLGALAQVEGLSTISELLAQIRKPDGKSIERDIIDAMTTNETSFFRDMSPFEAMKNFVVPELVKCRAGAQGLNIWCAASSTGQEPYSLAILIRETFPQLSRWKINFVASDLSRDVLDRARAGQYSQHEVDRGEHELAD
jgi:chemotaxis protein methyltransferase CheR